MSQLDTVKVRLSGNINCFWEILNSSTLTNMKVEDTFYDTSLVDTGVAHQVFVLTKERNGKDSLSFGYVCDQIEEETFGIRIK